MSRIKKGFGFFTDVRSELNKVTWTTQENLKKFFTIVIIFIALMSVFLGGVDYILTYLANLLFG